MDASGINRLFNDQKYMQKYIKKDYIRIEEKNVQETYAKITGHTLTDKLIDFSKGELIITGHIESTNGTPLPNGDDIGLQNGFYSVFRDVKISFNNNQVEHNREPLFTSTYVNLLEYSPDYASSIATQYGFIRDTELDYNGDVNGARNATAAATFRNNQVHYTLTIALRDISQFMRRLNFPIMNQLFEIELNVNPTQSIIRRPGDNGAQPPVNFSEPSRFVMEKAELFVPEVVLPSKQTEMLYKSISNGRFVKDIEWDDVEIQTLRNAVQANNAFDELLGTNLVGVTKIIVVVLQNYNSQTHNQTTSGVTINDFNVEIAGKDYFNTNIRTDQAAYRLLVDNFNMSGQDMNTGSLLPIDVWRARYKIYAVDISRQEVFEGNPYAVQQIRIRGIPSAAGRLRAFMFKNKKTQIDYARPENTRTIHN